MKIPNIKQLLPNLKSFTKNCRPILQKVLIKNKALIVTDLETSLRIDNIKLSDGLHDITKISLLDSPCKLNVDDYPCIDFNSKSIEQLSTNVKEIADLLKHSSKDGTRIFLESVCWNKNQLVATDGYTLKTINKNVESLESRLLPRKSLEKLIKLLKKYKVDDFDIEILDNNHFRVKIEDAFTLVGKLIMGDFPHYKKIIPTKTTKSFEITENIDFKTIRTLLNDRYPKIVLTNKGDNLLLNDPNSTFSIKIGTTKHKKEICINLDLLERILKTNDCKIFKYNNELSPILIENNNGISLLMPMR